MSSKTINARIKQKRDTDSNWQSKNPIILDGEIILVDMSDGELRAKIGDGTTRYNLLPFSDEPLRNLIDTVDTKVDEVQVLVGDTSVSDQIEDAVDKCITGLSVSGTTITYTKGDGSTGTITTQDTDTTYSNASLGQGYGTCDTAAATAAKVVTLSNYALATGGIVSVKFTNAVPASATMNINSKGAKAIYYKGKAIIDGIICAGEVATFVYDGTRYHLLTVDRNRFFTSLVPMGVAIPENADLNTLTYLKVGNYYCSSNATAKTLSNCPTVTTESDGTKTGIAFMMTVSSPLSQTVDDESGTWKYRFRTIQVYNGPEYTQYCYSNGTAGNWIYGTWYKTIKSSDTATTSTAGLMSASDKTKLNGIATGANKTVVDDALSSTSTNPVQNKVVNTAISNLNTLVGDASVSSQISEAVDKCITGLSASGRTVTYTRSDGTTGTITTQDTNTTYSAATTSAAGLMSATDKSNLDSATTKLAASRTLSLSGAVSGSTTFTGSGNIAVTTTNAQHISNKESGARYYKLGTMVADNSSNFGNITITGRIGGWEQSNSAYFEIMMLNRSSARDGNTITATVSAAGQVATALTFCDIQVYKQSDTSEVVYLKTNSYWLYDFDWSAYQHSITYDGTYVTSTPSGALVWSLSTAPKTILDASGNFSVGGIGWFANGVKVGGTSQSNASLLATQSYVDDKISDMVGDTAVSTQISSAISGISHPVKSVNGKTGAVTLSASDVGAAASSHSHSDYMPKANFSLSGTTLYITT